MSEPKKKFMVSLLKGSKKEDGGRPYRNVHKVEVLAGGTLALQTREDSTVLINHMTWETCRIDVMRPGD